jgi:CRP-like cAMP-binding protein
MNAENFNTDVNIDAPAVPVVERKLASHPFLRGLSSHQLRLICDFAGPVFFEKNQTILRAGEPATRFYLLYSGRVLLESFTAPEGKVPIQELSGGDVLGWSWMIPPYFWHFDARAVEPTDALYINGVPLRMECENDHDFGYELYKRILEVLFERLQSTRRRIVGLGATPQNLEVTSRARTAPSSHHPAAPSPTSPDN